MPTSRHMAERPPRFLCLQRRRTGLASHELRDRWSGPLRTAAPMVPSGPDQPRPGSRTNHADQDQPFFEQERAWRSMPSSVSGSGFPADRPAPATATTGPGFYALDVGLGFASRSATSSSASPASRWFLCPRCRAGACKRHPAVVRVRRHCVSMPSVSGWGLQGSHRSLLAAGQTFLCPRCRAGVCKL